MEKKTKYLLICIFTVTLLLRLILAFYVPNFTFSSYFHLRQVEEITASGFPIYNDDLSYGGRINLLLPFFHYLMALFNLVLPLEIMAKIIPNLLIAALTVIIFLISKKVTENETASLFSALIAGLLPILFFTNSFTNEILFLVLIFLAVYFFLKLQNKQYLSLYILVFLLASLTHLATILLVIGLGIYLLLLKIDERKINPAEVELILFSAFFYVWVQFLFFKKIILEEGLIFFWQNVPPQIIMHYFPNISLTQAILFVGVLPFLIGIFMVYQSLFHLKNRKLLLLISLVISTTTLAWLRIIPFNLSLSFFGLILAILFAPFYELINNYLQKTKLIKIKKYFSVGLILILIFSLLPSAVLTALQQDTPTNEEVAAFKWLKENTSAKEGVVALLEEGHLITYYSQRKNLMDDRFGMIANVEQRFTNLDSLFTTNFQTHALSLLDQYDYHYLIYTPHAQQKYKQNTFPYLDNECFEQVYNQETKIYLAKCMIKGD